MSYQVQLETGHTLEFDDAPTQEMVQQAASQLYGQQKQESGGLLANTAGVAAKGLGEAASSVAGAAGMGIGLAGHALDLGGMEDFGYEMARTENTGESGSIKHDVNTGLSALGLQPAGLGKKAAGLVGSIAPMALGPVGMTGVMGGQSVEHAQDLQDQGVSQGDAEAAALGGYALNTAGGVLFPGVAGKLFPGSPYIASAAGMTAQGAVSRGAEKAYLKSQGYTDVANQMPEALDTEAMVTDAIFGAAAHRFFGEKPQARENEIPVKAPEEPTEAPPELAKGTQLDMFGEHPPGINGELFPTEKQRMDEAYPKETRTEDELHPQREWNPKLPTETLPLFGEEPPVGHTQDLFPETKVQPFQPEEHQEVAQSTLGRTLSPEEQTLTQEQTKGRTDLPGIETSRVGTIGANDFYYWADASRNKDISHLVQEDPKQYRDSDGAYAGSIDAQKALDWISSNSASHLKTAANMLKKLPHLMDSLEITGITRKSVFDGAVNAEGHAAQYHPLVHRIFMGADHLNDQTLIHEMLHAATDRGITLSETQPGKFPALDLMVKDLKSALEELRAQGDAEFTGKDDTFYFDKALPDVKRGPIYGMTNIKEMISEAWSNSGFQALLKRSNLLDSVMNTVRKGLGNMPKSAFDRIVDTSSRLAAYNEKNFAAIDKQFMKKWPGDTRSLVSPMRRMAEDSRAEKMGEDHQLKAATDIPGGRRLSEEYIAPMPKPEAIIELAKGEKDIPSNEEFGQKMLRNFTVSMEQFANVARTKSLGLAARIFDRGLKLGNYYEAKVVTPLRENIKRIIPDSNWKSLSNIRKVMMSEDFDKSSPEGKRLTPQELATKLNPKEQQVYKMLRDAFDKQMQHVNEHLIAQGEEPIKPRDAYAHSAWSGPWSSEVRIKIRDKSGNVVVRDGVEQTRTVGRIADHTMAGVRKGTAHVMKQNADFVVDPRPVYKQATGLREDNYIKSFKEMTKLLGENDPAVQSLRRGIEEHLRQQGYSAEGFDKLLEPKAGVRFGIGDRPWVDERTDTQAWYRAQLDALHDGYKWSAMQESVATMKKIISDPWMIKNRPNMVDYLQEHSRVQLGHGKIDAVGKIENMIAETLGRFVDTVPGLRNVPVDVRAGANFIRNAKSLIYLKALGFWKPQHFLVNGVFQPFFTMPRHMKLSAEGYSHNPLTTLTNGMRDAQAILLDHYTNGHGPELTDMGKDMANYLKTNQIASNNPFSDVGELGRTPTEAFLKKSQAVGGYFMQEGERVARVNAFTSFVHHLDQSGKFTDRMELFREAERQTTETMGSFKHSDRPMFFTKMGIAGNGMATLRQFEVNFMNQFHDYTKYAGETKNYGPLMAFSGIQLAFAGVMGFVGFETADQIWKFLRDLVPTSMVNKEFAEWSPKKWALENLPIEASRGPVSTVSGINFASSLEAGTIVDPSMTGILPFLSEIHNTVVPVWDYISNPTSDNLHKMVWNETPYGSRGWLETGKAFGQDLPQSINTRNWYTRPNGVVDSPNNPGQGVYQRTPEDENIRSWGFTSTKEALTKEGAFMAKDNDKMFQDRQKVMVENMDSAMRNGDTDKMGDYLQKYVAMQGDPSQALTNQHVYDMAMRWNLDYQRQVAMGTKSYEGVMKYQRLHQMLNQIKAHYGQNQADVSR
jgi:hypothetical protein